MSLAIRFKLLVTMLAAIAVVVVVLQRRSNSEFTEALENVRDSQHQIALLNSIDRAMNRQAYARDRQAPAHATFVAQTNLLLAELRASAERESSPRELDIVAKLEGVQAGLVSGRASAAEADENVDALSGDLLIQEQAQVADASTTLETQATATTLVGLFAIVTLIAGIVFGFVVPLRRFLVQLIAATRKIAAGDLVTPVSLSGPRDLAELGSAVDAMRCDLHEHLGREQRIEDLRRFDEALRASEERYRALFDRSPLPMWVFDRETLQLRAVNDAMVAVHGYSKAELLAMRMTDLTAADAIELVRTTPSLYVGVKQQRGKAGSVELDITSHEIMMDDRVCMLSVGVDVSAARKVDAQLRQAQKMDAIGQLAGGVAHDFNNILAVIQLNAELLAAEIEPSSVAFEDVKEIGVAATRGAGLTRQLLAFSRQEKINPVPLAINDTVIEVEKMLTRIVGEDVEIATKLSPLSGIVNADSGQLEQVLLNLVVNARDAMPQGGRIAIATGSVELDAVQAAEIGVPAGRYATLAVSDTGCGMDEQTKARIFEPFFTTKAVGKGTGLGLANVFGIASQSGGAIVVESEVGVGSTFRMYLPCIDMQVPEAQTARKTTMRGQTRSATILLVEDEDQVRSAVRRMVTSWGCSCIEARNGAHALAVLDQHQGRIDVLLTDLVMPGMNGRALAARINELRPEIKVLLMSGYTEHRSIATEAARPNELFVAKPFSAATLAAAIGAALSEHVEPPSAESMPLAAPLGHKPATQRLRIRFAD